jgi:hypothetical protein
MCDCFGSLYTLENLSLVAAVVTTKVDCIKG